MSDVRALVEAVQERMATLRFKVFHRACSLNLVGLRTPNRMAGLFDDWLLVFWWGDERDLNAEAYPVTTSPSAYYLKKPLRKTGAANMVADRQWRSAYVIGKHGKRQYPALVQRGRVPITYTRDGNLDKKLDGIANHLKERRGYIGTNIHASDSDPFDTTDYDRSGGIPGEDKVGVWGAGCQVFARSADYRAYWNLVTASAAIYGEQFSYTLLELTPDWCPEPDWLNLEET